MLKDREMSKSKLTKGKDSPRKKRVAFFLIDGVGDCSYSSLGGKSPLQSARTPNIDKLSTVGKAGMMDPFSIGHTCGSDTAHMSIFGYDPMKWYTGRGCFECMGAGLHLEYGDIGFKSNFSTLVAKGKHDVCPIVKFRRCDRNFEKEGLILCKYLSGEKGLKLPGFPNHVVMIKYATEHRCGVRVRGKGLSNKITGTDPLKDNLELVICKPTVGKEDKEYKEAKFTSDLINALSDHVSKLLMKHEINVVRKKQGKNVANVILFRGCGTRIKVPTFSEKYNMKGFMIAPTCIISGFGLSIGLDMLKVKGATGDAHTNVHAKGKAMIKKFQESDYDFCFLHIKGIDDLSHDNKINEKVKMIEDVDLMIGNTVSLLGKEKDRFVVVITGDHTTPCMYKDHSFEPVPFLIADAEKFNTKVEKVKQFSEVHVYDRELGRFPGSQVFKIIEKC